MKKIGIKLADGSFFPVMEEGNPETKNLNLTTANNNQTCVMVDLFRSESGTMDDAEYIDTLKIENLNEHPNGEPSLSFSITLDEDNQLKANISDPETGARSDSTIPLISRTPEELEIPDDYTITESNNFDIDSTIADETISDDFNLDLTEEDSDPEPIFIPSGSSDDNPLNFQGLYDKETEMGDSAYHEENLPKKSKISVWICISCAIICILATLILLLFIPISSNIKKNRANAAAKDDNSVAIVEQETNEIPKAPDAKENEILVIKDAQTVEPAVTQKVQTSNVQYKIKWGDTLWDIAETYYKNPWKYKKISNFNGIKNPDHIISGTVITIPAL